jgi:hypothetical protein
MPDLGIPPGAVVGELIEFGCPFHQLNAQRFERL